MSEIVPPDELVRLTLKCGGSILSMATMKTWCWVLAAVFHFSGSLAFSQEVPPIEVRECRDEYVRISDIEVVGEYSVKDAEGKDVSTMERAFAMLYFSGPIKGIPKEHQDLIVKCINRETKERVPTDKPLPVGLHHPTNSYLISVDGKIYLLKVTKRWMVLMELQPVDKAKTVFTRESRAVARSFDLPLPLSGMAPE